MQDAPSPSEQPAAGATYEVPVEGSLALLALGARGIEAWRAKRAEVEARRGEAERSEAEQDVPPPNSPDAPSDD